MYLRYRRKKKTGKQFSPRRYHYNTNACVFYFLANNKPSNIVYVAHDTFFLGIRHIFFQVYNLYEFECPLKKLNEPFYN